MGSARAATEAAKLKVLEYVGKGRKLDEALAYAGRSRTTYEEWRRRDATFRLKVDLLRKGGDSPAAPVGEFEQFCQEFLFQPLYWHQLQWVDLLEGRPPRDLHPAQTFEKGDPNFILCNTPPEHAKTTTITINYVTYRIVKDPNIRIVVCSKTVEMAKQFMYAIKQRLTHPKYSKLQMTYAPSGGWAQDAEMWSATKVYLGAGRDSGEKDPTLQAIGIGGQIYGARADLIIVDDAIVLSNAHEFEKQIPWLQQEVLTRLGPTGRLLVVGTRVASVDMYRELRNPERYPVGESPWTYLAQPAVLEFGEKPDDWITLWPRAQEPWLGSLEKTDEDGLYPRWDGKHLNRRRGLLAPRTWSMAYMQHDVSEDAVFRPEVVQRAVNGMRRPGLLDGSCPGHRTEGMAGLYVVATMDPAMVGDTAVIVMAVDRHSKRRYVLDAKVRTGATPAWIKGIIKEVTEVYPVNEWRIEKNAFQAYLSQDPELREWLGARGVRLSEHHTGKNKWDGDFGVAAMAPVFEAGYMELPSTVKFEAGKQLIEQLITWSPETKGKTDLVMALWFAEIRARELIGTGTARNVPSHAPNRWANRSARERQMVVNLNDLAISGR